MNVIYIPYKISFNEDFNTNSIFLGYVFEGFPVYIFSFDIALSFNLAFYLKGDFISDRL